MPNKTKYPLCWPSDWTKRPFVARECSRFKTTLARATHELLEELRRLGATDIILSTNVVLKNDGLPRSSQRPPEDTAIAVYFNLNRQPTCIPCDKWNAVQDNVWAVAKTIDAIRGMERWGAKELIQRAFTGFKALPAKALFFERFDTQAQAKSTYREYAKKMHPDVVGVTNAVPFTEMLAEFKRLPES